LAAYRVDDDGSGAKLIFEQDRRRRRAADPRLSLERQLRYIERDAFKAVSGARTFGQALDATARAAARLAIVHEVRRYCLGVETEGDARASTPLSA
jgi:hypothetical protein